MSRWWIGAVVTASIVGAGPRSVAEGGRGVSIVGGTEAPADRAVVAIAHVSAACTPDPPTFVCTGTLIAPRIVLTAAHCVADEPVNAFAVGFAPVFGDDTPIPVVGGRASPAYDATTHANDVAVLVLGADAPAGTTPIALRATALPDLAGTDVRLVGYGITTATASDVGVRRAGTALVTTTGADDVTLAPGPAMSCHGDSGGPVLAPAGAGEELVGVTAYGDPACTQFGVAIRVDRQLAFIQAIVDDPTPRRAFDPDEPFCSATCTTDTDCPSETVCSEGRCAFHGLPAGELGAACTQDTTTCPCVALPERTCRTFAPCIVEGNAACPTASGCCDTGPPPPLAIGLVLVGLRAQRNGRSGAKKRSKRASSSPVASR